MVYMHWINVLSTYKYDPGSCFLLLLLYFIIMDIAELVHIDSLLSKRHACQWPECHKSFSMYYDFD
jgi:hypothetical protein